MSGEYAARSWVVARTREMAGPLAAWPGVVLVVLAGMVMVSAPARVQGFLVVSGGVLLAGGVVFGRVRRRAVRRAGPEGVTPATVLTGLRLVGIAVVAGIGLAVAPVSTGAGAWAVGVVFGVVAALDYLDGAVARLTDSVTEFGRQLDTQADALVVLVGAVVVVYHGVAPGYYLVAGVVWYGFRAGVWWRRARGLVVHGLPRSRVRRGIGALQLVVMCAALLPVTPAGVGRVLATVALVPLLVGFVRDWLAVCGRY